VKLAAIIVLIILVILAGAGLWLYTPDKSRDALLARYGAAPSQFLTLAGLTLHVRDTGPRAAPVIVLLHGFGASLHTWDDWAETLSAEYRVIRYDQPGFGLTGADPTGDYSDARSLLVLTALLDHLGVAKAIVVGNSMGGRIAWEFAAASPARVTKLVLISPDGFASPGIAYDKTTDVPAMVRMLPYTLPTAMLRMSMAPSYADPKRLSDTTLARYRDMMLAPGVRPAMIARMKQMVLHDPVARLRSIQAPTLLLWGEKDGMIPFANASDYVAAIPHAKLIALPTLGHVPQEESQAESLAAIRSFLAE
jgi:pimeloyl-ACP methyl ester carboxylesterase